MSTEVEDPAEPSGADLDAEAMYMAEADKELDEEEELFNLEELIETLDGHLDPHSSQHRQPSSKSRSGLQGSAYVSCCLGVEYPDVYFH